MALEAFTIGRQPILDREERLFAYELLFRGSSAGPARVDDDRAATAAVIHHAFAELGLERALGPHRGFVNCDARLLLSDLVEILPPERIVLEILETVEVSPALVKRVEQLVARGFTVAIDDFVGEEARWRPLLDLVTIVKVDVLPLSPLELEAVAAALRRWPRLTLLAEKVERREQVRRCRDLGFTLFQGYFFARPELVEGRRLGHSHLALLRLLGLVVGDAETRELEAVFKHEPGLAVNLMRMTNSVAMGLRAPVTSLRHAITALGRRQLQRWLQLLAYTPPGGQGPLVTPLLELAATRGHFLERLVEALRPEDTALADQAFMTGLLSLVPALVGAPMDEVLDAIALPAEVQAALQRRGGLLGTLLDLAESLEAGDGPACEALTARIPGARPALVNRALIEAAAWAAEIGQQLG